MAILGLDIGGANIKAADASGRATNRPFEVWRHPERLTTELASVLQEFPDTDQIALTMTAELADCFSTKAEGVRFILDAVGASVDVRRNPLTLTLSPQSRGEGTGDEAADCREGEAPAEPRSRYTHRPRGSAGASPSLETSRFVREGSGVVVWSTDGEFIPSSDARDCPQKIAASNWHALATWCGRFVPDGTSLLIDIGTTTTDIIPLHKGRPIPMGLTDVDRLQSGELSYFGVRRTPVCAVAHSVPFRSGYCPLAAELFATSLDIYLLLGHIAENEQNVDTANGKPVTKAAAHDRLARMLCCDRNEISFDEAVEVARFLADVQRQRLAGALERVIQRLPTKCQAVILSGSGAFLALQLVSENRQLANINVVSLGNQLSAEVSEAACAYAVAQLATQMSLSTK